MTKIIDKLRAKNNEIKNAPEGAARVIAKDLADLGRKALFDGINSPAWEKYMKLFATTPQQLARLTGKDESFNQSEWGIQCLAYIASNSTCTIDTNNTTGTERNMTPEMILALDKHL